MSQESTNYLPILFIDKPRGITSHDVVNQVRRQTGVKRVGHAGTLDPLATGLLIILVGRDVTKKQAEFLHLDKEYVCSAQLGVETDTYDREGQVVATAAVGKLMKISEADLSTVLEQFRGLIHQTVPAYSAVKIHGQKLYEKARKGQIADITELPSRLVEIKQLQLLEYKKDEINKQIFFTLKIHCSSGTYIRSLVHDIGQALEVGATVTSLRRTKIGEYSVENAVSLSSLRI